MERRSFLTGALAGFASALVIDPERLLWVPGRKVISLPKSDTFYCDWWTPGYRALKPGSVFDVTALYTDKPNFRMESVTASGSEGLALFRFTDKPTNYPTFTCLYSAKDLREKCDKSYNPLPNRYRRAL
jgi:hypothetical protein